MFREFHVKGSQRDPGEFQRGLIRSSSSISGSAPQASSPPILKFVSGSYPSRTFLVPIASDSR